MKNIFYSSNPYTLQVNRDLCIGCGLCGVVCPYPVFRLKRKAAVINVEQCIGCGACTNNCPTSAITVVPGEASGPLLINRWWSKLRGRKVEECCR
ncbi:indolepyruvate ferredoxin oxidoreductase subunit alpha [Desulfogranum japonicum]|uniref:indolepyruvate ferredoxin oxidoreductase subunit alpha n=1 Tax=Desulfogranum japonicum TaxID=231447 RepID=UPI000410741A